MDIRFEKRSGTNILQCRIYLGAKKEIRFSTGVVCDGRFYKTTQQAHTVAGKNDVELNARLRVMRDRYVDFVAAYKERHGIYPSSKEVSTLTANIKEHAAPLEQILFDQYLPLITNQASHSSIRSSLRQYKEFCQDYGSIVPARIKEQHGMRIASGVTDEVAKHFVAFRNWVGSTGASNRTVKTRVSHVGMAYRSVTKHQDYMPSWKAVEPRVDVHDDDVIAFDDDFVDSFKARYEEERGSLSKGLQQAYDYAIIAIVTGWRHQSIVSIEDHNLVEVEGVAMLKSVSDKTQRTQVAMITPVLNLALTNSMNSWGTMSPRMVPSTINRKLSELLLALGYTKPMSFTRNTTKGKKEVISKPMNEWASPHTLRRTAMTYYLKKGIDQRVVKNIGGFAPNSTAFSRYASYTERDVANAMAGIQ